MRKISKIRANPVISAVFAYSLLTFPVSGQDASWFEKHYNKEKHYYEGLFDQPNAKQAYEVLGFFASDGPKRAHFDAHPEEKSKLRAWFYVPKQDGGDPTRDKVTIRAKQIGSRTNYLLKSDPVPARKNAWTSFSWETEPFIWKYQINPNNLGVLAQFTTNDNAENEILPVVFALDCRDEDISHYELLLKIQRYSLANLAYSVQAPASGSAPALTKTCQFTFSDSDTCGTPQPNQGTFIEVGSVVQLRIPMNAAAGWVTLHIFGPYKDSSESLGLTYRFFHQPEFRCTHGRAGY